MKTTIFYFSATGNSLHFAKQLAKGLNADKLISISEAISNAPVETSAERVGLVFPVYAWGPPRIVLDFLRMITLKGKPYIFSTATCVGIPAKTLITVRSELRKKGADLDAGFVIRAERSSLMKMNALDKIIIALDRKRKRLQTGDKRLKQIISTVQGLKKHEPETSSWAANIFGTLFHDEGIDYFKSAAGSFKISGDCKGCGICVRVCPRSNINLVNGLPRFDDNCEFCHACIQWCPEFAITHPDFDTELSQYTNPNVRVNDLVVNA